MKITMTVIIERQSARVHTKKAKNCETFLYSKSQTIPVTFLYTKTHTLDVKGFS